MFVALADPTRRRLLDVLAAEWDARLAAIKRLAEAEEPPP